jgi:ElaB/YqjD/DUF883 family membrane-anchored ribosome-binding protein
MPAETMSSAAHDAANATASAKKAAKAAVATAVDRGQEGLADAMEMAERNIREAAKRIERAVRDGVETLKAQTEPYRDSAGAQFDEAQKFVVARVKERPLTATLAGVGVGLLLGLLLASRSNK